jgi:hypothetical protein
VHAKPARKQASQLKQITVEEYDALKHEISVLKEQVSALMKNSGPAGQQAAAGKPVTKTDADRRVAAQQQPTPPPKHTAEPSGQAASTQTAVVQGLAEGDRKQEAEEAQRQLDTFLRSQKLLFKKGQLQTELSATYSSDVQINNCAILGPYTCKKNGTDTVVTFPRISTRAADLNLIARYGVMDNVEFDLFVPVSYLEQEFSYFLYNQGRDLPNNLRRQEAFGIGDVSASLRYALWREDGTWPDVTLSLDAKSTTGDVSRGLGTGFWNVGGSVTLVKSIDPVVLFGSLGYIATLESQGYDPGDQVPYSLGMGFSLNDRVSFRLSVSGAVVQQAHDATGRNVTAGTGYDTDSLQFSTTIQQQKNLFFEPFVGFGLTEESPDFFAGVRIPYRFSGTYPLPFLN